jgi:hypothetical protein
MEDWLKHFVIVAVGFTIFFILVTSFNSTPTGRVVDDSPLNYYLDNPDKAADTYNTNIEKVPGFVKTMFGNERINAALMMENGSIESFGIITKKGKIDSIQKGYLDNPSLYVKTNESVVNGFLASENQLEYLRNALDTKAIQFEAVKAKTKLKMGTAMFLFKAYVMFNK